jgi:hypothetical protein
MSLTTDGFALGAAVSVAVGSTIQVCQAYADLNEKAPFKESAEPVFINSVVPLILAVLKALFRAILSYLRVLTDIDLRGLAGIHLLAPVPAELDPGKVGRLTAGQSAALASGRATALTPEQAAALNRGETVELTDDQVHALRVALAKDVRKWLGWFIGWVFIVIGALVAVAGAALALVNDL